MLKNLQNNRTLRHTDPLMVSLWHRNAFPSFMEFKFMKTSRHCTIESLRHCQCVELYFYLEPVKCERDTQK